MSPAHYVCVRSAGRTSCLVGPFPDKESADRWVEPTRRYAVTHIDGYAWGYDWGVASTHTSRPPLGRLNAQVGYDPTDQHPAANTDPAGAR
jgi:hypothetical protein